MDINLCICRRGKKYDVVFVDQVSAAIPAFLLLSRSKVCRAFPYANCTKPIWEQPGILGGPCTIASFICANRAQMFQTEAAVLAPVL